MRRRQSPFSRLWKLILLGALAGVIFVIYDGMKHPLQPTVTAIQTPTMPPTTTPSEIAQNPQPTPQPTIQTGIIAKAELVVPETNITAPIIDVFLDGESWDISQLGDNVGHLQGTSWFDQSAGNVVLSGHVHRRNGMPGIFHNLKDLDVGDPISVIYQNQRRDYIVSERRTVEPTDLEPLYPSDDERLTLITCDDYDLFQGTYQKRVIVVATRVNS